VREILANGSFRKRVRIQLFNKVCSDICLSYCFEFHHPGYFWRKGRERGEFSPSGLSILMEFPFSFLTPGVGTKRRSRERRIESHDEQHKNTKRFMDFRVCSYYWFKIRVIIINSSPFLNDSYHYTRETLHHRVWFSHLHCVSNHSMAIPGWRRKRENFLGKKYKKITREQVFFSSSFFFISSLQQRNSTRGVTQSWPSCVIQEPGPCSARGRWRRRSR